MHNKCANFPKFKILNIKSRVTNSKLMTLLQMFKDNFRKEFRKILFCRSFYNSTSTNTKNSALGNSEMINDMRHSVLQFNHNNPKNKCQNNYEHLTMNTKKILLLNRQTSSSSSSNSALGKSNSVKNYQFKSALSANSSFKKSNSRNFS